MDNQTPEDPFRLLARERSHEDARQTVATNRMLVLTDRLSELRDDHLFGLVHRIKRHQKELGTAQGQRRNPPLREGHSFSLLSAFPGLG